jgi:hypothetical protein
MAAGRCSGCGRTGSLRKINLHIVHCQSYVELYAQDPSRCLDPVAEWRRHRRQNDTPMARAEQRGQRLSVRFAEINRQQQASASRWLRPPDLLE